MKSCICSSSDPKLLVSQFEQFLQPDAPALSRLCNALSVLYCSDPHISWCGLYLRQPDGSFALGPFLGKPACMVIVPGKGIIGRCAQSEKPVIIDDVLSCADHIACDSESRSEAVLPLFDADGLAGVLDLDSDVKGFFSSWDISFIRSLSILFSDLFTSSSLKKAA